MVAIDAKQERVVIWYSPQLIFSQQPFMTIEIKDSEALEKMRIVGALAARQLEMIEGHIKPGISTGELDRICHAYTINEQDAIPAPLNYRGFPKSICTSVNHVVCHGIPGDKTLKKSDCINIDITVIKDGYHGDSSRMFMVGKATIQGERVARISYEAMMLGIAQVKPCLLYTSDAADE